MRRFIPSFRIQIIFVVLCLVILSALFLRYFFLDSFDEYVTNVEKLDTGGRVNQLYREHSEGMAQENRDKFREDVESVLSMEWERDLQANLFRREISLYSVFIFIFLVISVLALFFVMFNVISRPLRRLQTSTVELSRGNWDVRVKESRFSPLNNLISSFNNMAGELQSNRKKLIQAEKETLWREMARVMAHEIKNPLTPIQLAVERLESKKEGTTEEFRTAFENGAVIIHEEIDSLRRLATEFSEFARLPEARISPHDLNEQIQDIVVPYQNQAVFEFDLSGNLPQFHADKTQMKQVFVNIIQNAIQSSGDECRIRISTLARNGTVGISIKTIEIDVRILAATNKDLQSLIEDGSFREDLYYRLNVVPITVPPLREREGDIEILTHHFLEQFAAELKMAPKRMTEEALGHLKGYPFPGNVRELKNLIERLYILVSSDQITKDDTVSVLSETGQMRRNESSLFDSGDFRLARKEFEVRYLTAKLEEHNWNITAVAKEVGMHQPNLSRKIKELGIKRDLRPDG